MIVFSWLWIFIRYSQFWENFLHKYSVVHLLIFHSWVEYTFSLNLSKCESEGIIFTFEISVKLGCFIPFNMDKCVNEVIWNKKNFRFRFETPTSTFPSVRIQKETNPNIFSKQFISRESPDFLSPPVLSNPPLRMK